MQLYFNPLSYTTQVSGKRPLLKPDSYPGFIIGFNPCRPYSRGHLEIASADPVANPRIFPNYLQDARDIEQVVAGARLIGKLQDTHAMRQLILGRPALDLTSAPDDALIDDFRSRCGSVFHPCGTCRMGPQDRGGVVDERLRVYGVEGLRVADASIFPNITSANTHAPSVMVGARAADFIQNELS